MTEPLPPRPVPGPPVPGPGSADAGQARQDTSSGDADRPGQVSFADLDQLPVAEHVAVFEDEHSRLQRELGTIDQL